MLPAKKEKEKMVHIAKNSTFFRRGESTGKKDLDEEMYCHEVEIKASEVLDHTIAEMSSI